MSRIETSPLGIIYLGSHIIEEDTTDLPHDSSQDKSPQTSKSGPMALSQLLDAKA